MFSIDYETKINELDEFKQKNENINKKFIRTQFDDLNIGDIIYIQFYPYSQKHIDDLYPLFGTIKEIKTTIPSFDKDNKNDMHFDNLTIEKLVLTYDEKIFDGFHYWTSYYGNTRGYEYSIYKLITTNEKIKSEYYISSDENEDNNDQNSDEIIFEKLNDLSYEQNQQNQQNESVNESFTEKMNKKRKFI